tara:strand:+ start:194 stop:397 length:204 start_codon:yes stop_codon:yes gene_type:complete
MWSEYDLWSDSRQRVLSVLEAMNRPKVEYYFCCFKKTTYQQEENECPYNLYKDDEIKCDTINPFTFN